MEASEPSARALTRREAIALGAVAALAVGCGRDHPAPGRTRSAALEPDELALMEAVADTILPATAASPGAREAGAGAAIQLLLTDCHDAAAQQKVVRGLGELRSRCRAQCGAGFASLGQADRERLLREVDAEAQRAGPDHWFHLVRELSQQAYFSSEVGMTRALRWIPVPGRWTGCVPLEPGQPAWG